MCRFIETIRVERGEMCNLGYHIERINATRRHFWHHAGPLSLSDIRASIDRSLETAKLRFVYDRDSVREISCSVYDKPDIRTLKIVTDNDIDYPFKSIDRNALERLRKQRGACDDILIVKHDHITDTSFTNVAFSDSFGWYTPDTPLLPGTRRASLLEAGLLYRREIRLGDLSSYRFVSLFNAMIDLGELVIPVENIRLP